MKLKNLHFVNSSLSSVFCTRSVTSSLASSLLINFSKNVKLLLLLLLCQGQALVAQDLNIKLYFRSPPPPPPNAHPPSPDPLQLSKEVSSLSQELSTLQADLTSFHQASTLRAEQFSSSHLQPALHLSLGHTKVILLDSLWSQAITRTGFAVEGPLRKREIEVNMTEEVPPSLLSPHHPVPWLH
jgi:hypothetical protein